MVLIGGAEVARAVIGHANLAASMKVFFALSLPIIAGPASSAASDQLPWISSVSACSTSSVRSIAGIVAGAQLDGIQLFKTIACFSLVGQHREGPSPEVC
eukprot:gnl/TRDRNA2_/TRDRNA2_210140_c0_seq1.p2 gnl/TRDRNA2_/TRDRNA2_210140_c0~~gnl/TRDRNA2_/TRDRNA2_210140_c0_seq1.p2  ORF type:complete len:100 (+),score=8.11 gnl/TRDRNA2_/TRDRNA2_210140_c0_seq1:152-451(+)